jgi:D-arabinose 1-dehydrogenase-like Zn-dependent alcohol dehydrogenase
MFGKLDTISAKHDMSFYISLLITNGTHIRVGTPPEPHLIPAFAFMDGMKSVSGSGIGDYLKLRKCRTIVRNIISFLI